MILALSLNGSFQQANMNGNVNFWRNNPQMMKPFINTMGNGINNNGQLMTQNQQQFVENYSIQQSPHQINSINHFEQNVADRKPGESKSYIYANGYPVLYNNVLPFPAASPPTLVVAPGPVAIPVPPAPVAAVPVRVCSWLSKKNLCLPNCWRTYLF